MTTNQTNDPQHVHRRNAHRRHALYNQPSSVVVHLDDRNDRQRPKRTMNLYTYKAKCTDVYDGDSVTLDIDLGFNQWMLNQKIRLYGIDTPEIRGAERETGLVSAQRIRELIENREVTLKSHKDKAGKYGRWLATIYLGDVNINELLFDEGLAVRYEK